LLDFLPPPPIANSRPSLQACRRTISPGTLMCSLNCKPTGRGLHLVTGAGGAAYGPCCSGDVGGGAACRGTGGGERRLHQHGKRGEHDGHTVNFTSSPEWPRGVWDEYEATLVAELRKVKKTPARGQAAGAKGATLKRTALPVRAYDKEVAEEDAARATFAHAANSVKRGAASA